MGSVDESFQQTREVLHRVAAHVLGRRRWDATGRFGLRVSPGGFATPNFGDDVECVRIAGSYLVRESNGIAQHLPIGGSSLRALASFVGADIESEFSCGAETPPTADVDELLRISDAHTEAIAQWFSFGWRVLDVVLRSLPESAHPATLQLWPEHFDIGTNVGLSSQDRVNLGCSPGDAYESMPYLYVGPWGESRPGDPDYWNASFGALLRSSDLPGSDAEDLGVQFMTKGVDLLSSEVPAT